MSSPCLLRLYCLGLCTGYARLITDNRLPTGYDKILSTGYEVLVLEIMGILIVHGFYTGYKTFADY